MSSPARNNGCMCSPSNSRGIALLVMLGIILVAFTTIAISRLSLSSAEQKSRARTTQALTQARDAIMAFAVNQVTSLQPPGTLPCPDGNADGFSDALVANVCPARRGLVPYRTLGITQLFDGTGAPIWYVVSSEYSGNSVTPPIFPPTFPRNSSLASSLRLNTTREMAFILFASNEALTGQVRTTKTPLAAAVAQYLEVENANLATDNLYTDLRDDTSLDGVLDTQNDQVLGMPVGAYWSNVEARVLREVNDHLDSYPPACGSAPAVPFANPNDDGVPSTLEGRVPLGNWLTLCPAATPLPVWLTNHWSRMLYYATCATPCIQLVDTLGLNPVFVSAIVIAPGIHFARPIPRNPATISDYFELENIDSSDNVFTQVKSTSHTDTFNDLIYVVR